MKLQINSLRKFIILFPSGNPKIRKIDFIQYASYDLRYYYLYSFLSVDSASICSIFYFSLFISDGYES